MNLFMISMITMMRASGAMSGMSIGRPIFGRAAEENPTTQARIYKKENKSRSQSKIN
jgi:hypothetical protein